MKNWLKENLFLCIIFSIAAIPFCLWIANERLANAEYKNEWSLDKVDVSTAEDRGFCLEPGESYVTTAADIQRQFDYWNQKDENGVMLGTKLAEYNRQAKEKRELIHEQEVELIE